MGRLKEAREVIARLRAITPKIMPNIRLLRNRDHRELFLSGLRLAAGEAQELRQRQGRLATRPNALSTASVSQPFAAPRLSIVVLPFANLSDDRDEQYFADGITDDLTTDLSRLENMFVISCNTAFTYRNKSIDTRQIGRELGVRYVLEGSVRRSGNRVRINTQLIDAKTDAHLWAERFDSDTEDLFALQNEITTRIANALNLELVIAEAARNTEHPDALDYVLRGRATYLKPVTGDTHAEAIEWYERALVVDPRSVEAQSSLASSLAGRVLDGMTDIPTADVQRAEDLVRSALTVSPRNPRAHFASGQLLRAQGRYEEAILEYEMVLALNRNWVLVIAALGWCKFLTGSIDEALLFHEQAIRLSPRDPGIGNWYDRIGRIHLLESRTNEAIGWLEKARAANPAHPGIRIDLGAAYALEDKFQLAANELAEARRLSGGGPFSSIAHLKAYPNVWSGVPKIRALYEATFFAGLRKAGMPEE
jgi:adenylate cyclase